MKLLVDDARLDVIKRLYKYYPVDGVTTNPSILAKCNRAPYIVLKEIRAFIGRDTDLHVQVVAKNAEGMAEDAHRIIKELGDATFVKIPCIPEGFKAMKQLAVEGIRTTGTAIYSAMQVYLAAKCGAEYAAPYINRIDNMGYDGIQITKEMQDILNNNGFRTSILAASFKNSRQVLELCRYGIGAATAAPDVIEGFAKNQASVLAVDDFVKDFEKIAGEKRTMSDC